MLVAAHVWDIAGATYIRMQTAFINRPFQSVYLLAKQPAYKEIDILLRREESKIHDTLFFNSTSGYTCHKSLKIYFYLVIKFQVKSLYDHSWAFFGILIFPFNKLFSSFVTDKVIRVNLPFS